MTDRATAYRGRVLTAQSGSDELAYLEDGLVVVSDDGRIEAVAPAMAHSLAGAAVDVRPAVIVPGFVDAHVHYPQTRIIGSATGPLLEWLERSVFPEEARFHDEPYARVVAREFVARALAVGTTTLGVFSSSSVLATNVLFEELGAAGVRALVGLTLMDQHCPHELRVPAAEALAGCRDLVARWHRHDGGRLRFAITPRFALSCSRALMEGAARLAADHELPIQTHVAENVAEDAATLRVHPFGRDYLDVYERVGLLTNRTVLAHAIHLSGAAWDRIADRGARIAHCPDSNFFLGSGRMRVHDARRRGVVVALGSDVAAGRTFSIQRAMCYAYDTALCVAEPLAPATLFRMATLDGARALGLDEATGSIEAGKEADLVFLRVPDYAQEVDQVLALIAFAADATHVERVLVRGKTLLRA